MKQLILTIIFFITITSILCGQVTDEDGRVILNERINKDSLQYLAIHNFREKHCNGIIDYSYAKFLDTADFSRCFFADSLKLRRVCFSKGCDFEWTEFHGVADFWYTIFDKTTFFGKCIFSGTADFRFAKFNEEVFFDNATLPDTLNFSHINHIQNEIDLTVAKTKPNSVCYINLFNSDISKIKIDYNKFKLCFDEINKDSTQDKLTEDQISSVYSSLLEKFKRSGMTESYKKLDLEFKAWKSCCGNSIFERFINCSAYLIQKYWWNFGYEKWRIFIWVAAFLLIFTIVTYVKFDYLMGNIYTIKFIHNFQEKYENLITARKTFYRITCSFIYSSVLFFGLKIEYDEIKFISLWTFYIFLIYTTGLICIAYLFNFVISK
ncbi:MAG: hypothetical protein JST55_14390 [Bacteroidetes bacterium]|nr:hypothetical protein [Bacteroidota bacterium]